MLRGGEESFLTNLMFASGKNPYEPLAVVGGAETSMRQIADRLAQGEHEVTYVCLKGSKKAKQQAKLSGVKLVFFPAVFSQIGFFWASPLIFGILLFVVATRRIQSTYIYYEPVWLSATYVLGKLYPKMKVTIGIFGLSWKNAVEQSGWRRQLFRAAFAQADSLNYQHKDLRPLAIAICRDAGIDIRDKPFFVGDIGIPVDELVGTKPHRGVLPRSKNFVVFVPTRFSSYQKRQDLIIEAVSLLPPKTRLEIRFAGDGVLEDAMKQLAKNLLHAEQYSFLGFLPQEQVWDEMCNADVVALPTEYEGLGKIVLEAMAIGTPVVVSDVVTLNSYIQDGENGFLVPNSPKSWAEVLVKLTSNPGGFEEVTESAQNFVKVHYSAHANISIFEENLC